MMIAVSIVGDDEDVREALKGGTLLQQVCQDEVSAFDNYLRNQVGGLYADGLATFEKHVLAGYLYQKLRGHIAVDDS